MRSAARLSLAAGVALGAASVGFLQYRADLGRAEAATRGSSIATTALGPIEYAEQGEGTPLLSIHGAGGGFDQGLSNAADLIGAGFRVIAPSRFGYLRTPAPADASPAAQADAHDALLAALDVPRAIVLGVSAGARSAVALALRHPQRVAALVLVVPGLYCPTSPVSVDASAGSQIALRLVNAGADVAWWAAEKIAPAMLIRFVGVSPKLFAGASAAERQRVMDVVRSIQPVSRRFAGINIDSVADSEVPPYAAITAPTLVISARDDLFNTAPAAEFAASRIPGARLIIYETGGHLLLGRRPAVTAAVRGFLREAASVRTGEVL